VESAPFDGAISATIRFSTALAGSSGESPTAMATLPPLLRYVSMHVRRDECRGITWNGRGGKHSKANAIGRSGGHHWPLPRSSLVLRAETSRGYGDPKTGPRNFPSAKDLEKSMRHALRHRQVAEVHGGKPWRAITNSASSHCHAVSHAVGQNTEQSEGKKHRQQPVENDQRSFCL
jgi:hypothetical protein